MVWENICRRNCNVQFKIHDDEYVYDERHGYVPYVHVHRNLMVFEGLCRQRLQKKDEGYFIKNICKSWIQAVGL